MTSVEWNIHQLSTPFGTIDQVWVKDVHNKSKSALMSTSLYPLLASPWKHKDNVIKKIEKELDITISDTQYNKMIRDLATKNKALQLLEDER
jgi:hypothetical protein